MLYRLGVAAGRLAAISKQGAGRAGLSTTTVTNTTVKAHSPVPKYLVEKMKLFQQPNNLPVHIKGGAMDKLLYYITGAVCTVGVIDCFHVYYVLSYPNQ